LNFDVGKLVGALISHEHVDHSKSAKELLKAGVQVYASKGTFEALQIQTFGTTLEELKERRIGNFRIIPFKVEHDAKQPFGFLINHSETGNILFATDTAFLNYKFSNLNQIIIEANFSEEILKQKSTNENIFLSQRIIQNHLSIEKCLDFLRMNDLKSVNNIVLIHLSDRNSHEKEFYNKIHNETNKSVHVANKNEIINFNLTPF
jgi:phosphoribosyl 1,2-cyclic phosphodiesterase